MLIIGLWNSDQDYDGTVHNIGNIIIKQIIKDLDFVFRMYVISKTHKKVENEYELYEYSFGNNKEIIILSCYGSINQTGYNIIANQDLNAIASNQIVLSVYDDISIKTGNVIMSYSKGSGHHNGVRGMDNYFSRNYWRLRFGYLKPTHTSAKDFVLSKIDNYTIYPIISKLSFVFIETYLQHINMHDNQILSKCQLKINEIFKG